MKVLFITLGILVVLIILAVLFDAFLRKTLFDYSLEAIEQLQAQFKSSVGFFEFLSFLCSEYFLIPFSVLIFFLFPLSKSFAFLVSLLLANYLDNVMKIIYGNPRPFWVKESLFKACDGGFGNPSGHSYVSTATYLSIAHLLIGTNAIKHKAWRISLNVLIALFFLLVISAIIFSRVYLGVHSINQVLYGSFLGAITYFFSFFVLSIQTYDSKAFFNAFNSNISIIICFILYLCGIILAVLLYFLIENKPDPQLIAALLKHCPRIHEYRKFNNDALFASFQLFVLFGAHTGIVLAFRMLISDKNSQLFKRVFYWNKGTLKQFGLKALLLIPFLLITVLYLVVPSGASLIVIFLFKIAFPFYLAGFFMFGPYLIVCSRLNLLPEEGEIKEESTSEQTKPFNNMEEVRNNPHNKLTQKDEEMHLSREDSINS